MPLKPIEQQSSPTQHSEGTAASVDIIERNFSGVHKRLDRLESRTRDNSIENGLLLLSRTILTESGVYTPTDGTTYAIVQMLGAGGGGGGCAAGGNAAGGGGASGALIRFRIGDKSKPITGGMYSCGSGGTAGTSPPTNGGNGGSTTLYINGTSFVAVGGNGGSSSTVATTTYAEPGKVGTGSTTEGIDTKSQESGLGGINISGYRISGAGASSPYGTPGTSVVTAGAGVSASGYGAGASGASSSASAYSGGTGSPGLIIIEEYK